MAIEVPQNEEVSRGGKNEEEKKLVLRCVEEQMGGA